MQPMLTSGVCGIFRHAINMGIRPMKFDEWIQLDSE